MRTHPEAGRRPLRGSVRLDSEDEFACALGDLRVDQRPAGEAGAQDALVRPSAGCTLAPSIGLTARIADTASGRTSAVARGDRHAPAPDGGCPAPRRPGALVQSGVVQLVCVLVQGGPKLGDVHVFSPSVPLCESAGRPSLRVSSTRSRASARDVWLFTVPIEQSSRRAVSASLRSSKNRNTITARWPRDRWPSAVHRSWRALESSTYAVSGRSPVGRSPFHRRRHHVA